MIYAPFRHKEKDEDVGGNQTESNPGNRILLQIASVDISCRDQCKFPEERLEERFPARNMIGECFYCPDCRQEGHQKKKETVQRPFKYSMKEPEKTQKSDGYRKQE